ncbi:MAG: hypothetical protein QXS21_02690 [Thermoproteota archaeon]|nr:hypothetical protein [Candidatus Brockarchaeota archaeon]MBO3801580.1 hypothetical protein [Candidatus Brockarchaeota archaeon]
MSSSTVEIKLVNKAEDEDVYDLYIDKKEFGKIKVYKVTEDEKQIMKSKLKKSVRVGDVFSVKVFLKDEVTNEEKFFDEIKNVVKSNYKRGLGRFYFLTGNEKKPDLLKELRWE